jgi:2-polyprenyl-3-methyl-5-hydroxy-6-metoxy-1,4-benzoquinol methylase
MVRKDMIRSDHPAENRARQARQAHQAQCARLADPAMTAYALKPDAYFQHARTEIEAWLPAHAPKVLEVGCGSGATIAWLKARGRCGSAWGIEIMERAAQAAREHVDHVESGNAEAVLERTADGGPYDLALCMDVLEHMVDPWDFMKRLAQQVKPGGIVIASVPNVRHYRVSLPLLFLGRFRYAEAGVLDRTHLRFFTQESAPQLVDPSLFELRECRGSRPPAFSFSWWLGLLSLGLLRDLFSVQYLLVAVRR